MPMRFAALIMLFIAWPEAMRRAHASVDDSKCAKSLGMVRVPFVPMAWHAMQPLVFTVFSHSLWLLTVSAMPLPFAPVPGKSLFGGILSSAYQ